MTWRTPSYDSGGGPDPTHPPRGPEQSASPPILAARVGGSTSSQAAGRLTARSRAPRAARCALEPSDALADETARGGAAAGRAGRPGSAAEACSCQHGRNTEGEEAQLSALQPPQPAGAAHAQLNASGGALTLARAVCNVQRAPACACVRYSCALGFTCPHSPHSQPPQSCFIARAALWSGL